jgi:hypothetical protein
VWCGGGFFTDYNTTPTKVVLSCFGLLVGLWQQYDTMTSLVNIKAPQNLSEKLLY